MSVSRISVVKFKSKEACDEMVESYTSNAPSEFPEAEQLLHIRIVTTHQLLYHSIKIKMRWKERLQLEIKEWELEKINMSR